MTVRLKAGQFNINLGDPFLGATNRCGQFPDLSQQDCAFALEVQNGRCLSQAAIEQRLLAFQFFRDQFQ